MSATPVTLATTAPSPHQHAIAALVAGLLVLTTVWFWGRADVLGPELPVAVGIYQSTVVVADLLTAVLLLIQVWQIRTADLLVLGCGYLATALLAAIQLLSFPNVAGPLGVVGGDAQTPPWLWNFWHLVFPLAVLGYANIRRPLGGNVGRTILVAVITTVAIVIGLFLLATRFTAYLPALIDGLAFTGVFLHINYPLMTALCAVALLMLVVKRERSVVSLWLAVSVLAFMLDVVNNWHSGARYAVGWYVGRGSGLVSSLLLLIVFVAETALLLRYVGAAAQRLEFLNGQLRQALRRAEEASEAKTRFFAAASHDLRQPFQAMRLFHGVLESQDLEPFPRQVVGRLGEAMAAGEGLLTSLLEIARIDSGTMEVKPQRLEVSSLLREIVSAFQPLAAEKGLRLRMFAPEMAVRSDPMILKRILTNLVSNSVRYTDHGGVLVAARRRHGRVVFEVWDSGIGMSPDGAARVFEEFYQAGNPNRDRSEGIGLGLPIVKRLSTMLDYQVAFHSRLGRGSVFRVVGPPCGAGAPSPVTPSEEVAPPRSPAVPHPMNPLPQPVSGAR